MFCIFWGSVRNPRGSPHGSLGRSPWGSRWSPLGGSPGGPRDSHQSQGQPPYGGVPFVSDKAEMPRVLRYTRNVPDTPRFHPDTTRNNPGYPPEGIPWWSAISAADSEANELSNRQIDHPREPLGYPPGCTPQGIPRVPPGSWGFWGDSGD